MSLSTNTMRGILRYLPGAGGKAGAAVQRLVVFPDTTSPVYGGHIRPTAAPSGTAAKGDFYFDSTANTIKLHDGTAFRTPILAGIGSAQVVTGTLSSPRVVKTAAATLTASDSGALCVFNSAAGDIYTLPTAAAGLWFDFAVAVTITSNAAKVITASASEFLVGGYLQIPDTAAQIVSRSADGTTIRAWSGNGSTTGGIKGDFFRLVGISATQWVISGIGLATGAEATPFATS